MTSLHLHARPRPQTHRTTTTKRIQIQGYIPQAYMGRKRPRSTTAGREEASHSGEPQRTTTRRTKQHRAPPAFPVQGGGSGDAPFTMGTSEAHMFMLPPPTPRPAPCATWEDGETTTTEPSPCALSSTDLPWDRDAWSGFLRDLSAPQPRGIIDPYASFGTLETIDAR